MVFLVGVFTGTLFWGVYWVNNESEICLDYA